MTSMPASRSARAMIFAPRSWPSRPGLATTTRILRCVAVALIPGRNNRPADAAAPRRSPRTQARGRPPEALLDLEPHLHPGMDGAVQQVGALLRQLLGEGPLGLRA